jgi:RNA 2',3'-cyclic 3'-phosphodiesterase
MRFFIALEIRDESKAEIEDVQQRLKQLIPNLRLTEPDKLHLTIAFVGEREDSLKEDLIEIMTRASHNISPFAITPAYLDGFPTLHHLQVLWVGVKGDIDKLMILRERVKDGLKELRVEVDERRFVPHIAVGKHSNYHLTEDIEAKLQELMQNDFKPIKVSSIKLFESIPDHGFHSHNTLAEIKLTNS